MYICNDCPRNCGIDRAKEKGFCNMGLEPKIARASVHLWEEPPISMGNGSGTVFFTGCALKCVFCQNYELSRSQTGKEITPSELASIFEELEKAGAHNINLVNPSHFVHLIARAFEIYKPKIPVVYNTHGYEKISTLEIANKFTDIYLPDLKFYSSSLS